MKALIPSPLRSYTRDEPEVDVAGRSVAEALDELNRRYPGMRFRMIDEQDQIRRHIKIFVNEELVRDLTTPLNANDRLQIVCALSGG